MDSMFFCCWLIQPHIKRPEEDLIVNDFVRVAEKENILKKGMLSFVHFNSFFFLNILML